MGNCFGRCLAGKSRRGSSGGDELQTNLVDNNSPDDSGIIYQIMKTKVKQQSKFLERFWAKNQDTSYQRLNKENSLSRNHQADIPLQSLDAHSLLITTRDRNTAAGLRPEQWTNATSSPVGSSLDLEWEHEYNSQSQSWVVLAEEVKRTNETVPCSEDEDDRSSMYRATSVSDVKRSPSDQSNLQLANCNNTRRMSRGNSSRQLGTPSKNSWSHISTPDSLEWDVNDEENQLKSEVDSIDMETMDLLHEIELLKNRVLSETGDGIREIVEAES